MFRVCTVNLHFHVDDRAAAASRDIVFIVGITDDRRTFCGTISDRIFETNPMHELFYLLIERRSAYNDLIEIATKGI